MQGEVRVGQVSSRQQKGGLEGSAHEIRGKGECRCWREGKEYTANSEADS